MCKIFVIGFNKTATTTFHKLFLKNNLRSQHDTIWQVNDYDCFSDNGDLNDFKKLDNDFPNSIFILNTRRLDKWMISRFKHGITGKLKRNEESNWAYPCTSELCMKWMEQRETHYLDVLDYFKNKPQKLIIIDIDKNNWEQYLSSLFKFKVTTIPPQHVSKMDTTNEEYVNMLNVLNETFNDLYYDTKEREMILFRDNILTEKYLMLYKNNVK